MKINITLLLFVFTFIYSICASAQIYKCTGSDGKITYSDEECSSDAELIKEKEKPKPKPKRESSRPFVCASGITAVVNNLHYPGDISPSEALELAESDLTSMHYRRAIKRVDPSGKLPKRVTRVMAEAFPASEVPGFSSGVVINARVCK